MKISISYETATNNPNQILTVQILAPEEAGDIFRSFVSRIFPGEVLKYASLGGLNREQWSIEVPEFTLRNARLIAGEINNHLSEKAEETGRKFRLEFGEKFREIENL
ncbi:hypothetical protein SAMN02745166_01750 [Prosthecobacter debontii]|uniref:Uncharacterized protein n=1 Tax=Prosthecobacter debontii TaxID=48467 RepID=A0A1T4XNW2_9BACT|nr:hypothetical protein [Prosthecobacter debontii]SKA90808.1 hypothetical protein SAMN02745166_01750 [Prosthecobacter debontii]